MPRKRRFSGHGLDRMPTDRKQQRVYDGKIGSVNTLHDIHEWISAVEKDRKISDKRRAKRLRFMYAITFSSRFKRQWRSGSGDLDEARKVLKRSYEQYMVS